MQKLILVFIFLLPLLLAAQSDPIGMWKAIDDEDGQPSSYIEIYEVGGKLHAKVVELLKEDASEICTECKGDKKNQPIVGMEIMWNMKKDGDKNEWKGGKIMDPKNGKEYKCKVKIPEEDILEVRGFVGFSLLGRTQKWYRVN